MVDATAQIMGLIPAVIGAGVVLYSMKALFPEGIKSPNEHYEKKIEKVF